MKKTLLAACAGLACFFISCNNATAPAATDKENTTTQKNLAASQLVSKAFETGNVSLIDNVIADDFINHTPDKGDIKGKDSLKAMITIVHAANKDMKMDVLKELADDEYVFSWMRFSGTSDGTMMAAGPYNMHGLEITKFKDGKAVEHWEYMDPSEMMKMMQPPAKESGSKKEVKK